MEDSTFHRFSNADILDLDWFFRTKLVNSISGPKPAFLVGTANETGQTNLAIMSSIVHVGANPPYLGMILRPDSVERHTLDNIRSTKSYTLNNVTEDFYKQAHQTSARYQRDQSEFDYALIEKWNSPHQSAPYVAKSSIRLGMWLREEHRMLNDTTFLVGEVREVFIRKDLLKSDGYVDAEKAGSLAAVGLDAYHRTELIARLSYAKPEKFPEELETD